MRCGSGFTPAACYWRGGSIDLKRYVDGQYLPYTYRSHTLCLVRSNVVQIYIANNYIQMKNFSRLAVRFETDGIADVEAIHGNLCHVYDVGYTGLYDCGKHMCLYIQTASKVTKMTTAKVLKICKDFGATATPTTFECRNGTLVAEVGYFRKCGRQKGSKLGGSAVNSTTCLSEGVQMEHVQQQATIEEKHEHESIKPRVNSLDEVFVPVYTGFDRNWKIVSWNRLTKDFKRGSTTRFRDQVLDRQNHKCNYCGCPVSFGDYSNADMDHAIPLHTGGVNALHNVQVLCVPDHRKKTALESRRLAPTLSVLLDGA